MKSFEQGEQLMGGGLKRSISDAAAAVDDDDDAVTSELYVLSLVAELLDFGEESFSCSAGFYLDFGAR